ncbi:hypothetical protein, partial [Ralstonia sp.]
MTWVDIKGLRSGWRLAHVGVIASPRVSGNCNRPLAASQRRGAARDEPPREQHTARRQGGLPEAHLGGYVAALVAGTVVTAVPLAVMKRRVAEAPEMAPDVKEAVH